MEEIFKNLANYGLAGILVAVLVWFLRHLVVVTLPKLTDTFTEQMRLEREDCLKRVADERSVRLQEFTVFIERIDKLCQSVVDQLK
jgi:hypothetical protein